MPLNPAASSPAGSKTLAPDPACSRSRRACFRLRPGRLSARCPPDAPISSEPTTSPRCATAIRLRLHQPIGRTPALRGAQSQPQRSRYPGASATPKSLDRCHLQRSLGWHRRWGGHDRREPSLTVRPWRHNEQSWVQRCRVAAYAEARPLLIDAPTKALEYALRVGVGRHSCDQRGRGLANRGYVLPLVTPCFFASLIAIYSMEP